MVQVVCLVLGKNFKIGLADDRNIIVHGNIDKVKFIDASGGLTVKELFPDNKVNLVFDGIDLTLHYTSDNIIVFSGYVNGYSIVTVDGEILDKYKLQANGVFVKTQEF